VRSGTAVKSQCPLAVFAGRAKEGVGMNKWEQTAAGKNGVRVFARTCRYNARVPTPLFLGPFTPWTAWPVWRER
jgi:hypothetical protein